MNSTQILSAIGIPTKAQRDARIEAQAALRHAEALRRHLLAVYDLALAQRELETAKSLSPIREETP